MTVYDATVWQGKLPGIFLALDDSRDNANSDAAQIVAHCRYTVVTDTADDGNPGAERRRRLPQIAGMTRTETHAADRRTGCPVLTSRRAPLTLLVTLLAVVSALLALGQIARADQHAKPAPPSARAAAHALLDRFNGQHLDRERYDWARGCTHGAQRGTIALQRFLKRFAPRGESMGIFNCRMTRGGSTYSLHAEGRALDWHLNIHNRADREQAQKIITMLLGSDSNGRTAALARRIGVQEIIWDCRIFSVRSMHWKRSGLCPPGRRVSDTIAHRDHLHIGLNWLGARQRTSFWRHKH